MEVSLERQKQARTSHDGVQKACSPTDVGQRTCVQAEPGAEGEARSALSLAECLPQGGHGWVPLDRFPFIAEELGIITPDEYVLRDQFRLPGMRILQLDFDGASNNPYLHENYVSNTFVYTGNHDNPTTREWFGDLPDGECQIVCNYLKRRPGAGSDVSAAFMDMAWSSAPALAIAPLQDLLNLGREARMNVPGRAEGNWRWRMTEPMLSDSAFEWLHNRTEKSNRSRLSETVHTGNTLAAGTERHVAVNKYG